MTGSSSFFFANSVRSRPKARNAGVLTSFFEDFVAAPLDIYFQTLEDTRRNAFTFTQKSQQNVLGPNVGMIERFRFLARERKNFFYARRIRNVANHLGLRPGTDLFLDLHPHRFEV